MDRSIKPRTTAAATESIWSSLPDGPVTEIGGRVLATGNVDYYVDMRAAFSSWRATMADPEEQPTNPRFFLWEWVMLDEDHPRDGRLFLNTDTGRFLHLNLPSLTNYYFVISTGGLLVLATRSPSHMVRVVNPLTPSCIKFRAPIPDSLLHTIAHLRLAGTTPTLVLEHPSGDRAYSATPNDEQFTVGNYSLLDKAHDIWGVTDGTVDDLLSKIIADRSWEKYPCYYYFLRSAGEMLLVLGRKHPGRGMEVFNVNFQRKVIEPTRSIGTRALFLGDRCVSIDTDKISSIDGSCIYYRGRDQHDEGHGIYKYDLTTENEEFITSDVVELFDFTRKPVAFSMIQLLVNYCTNIPWSQLEIEQRYGHLQPKVHMEE